MTTPTVVVTGAGSGIGAAVAAKLRATGANVLGLDLVTTRSDEATPDVRAPDVRAPDVRAPDVRAPDVR
ncbi:SDR family NAD(P)-dependent oxidoreductase, partial [Cryptosporangium minutisporangium]|uniref:SDR family NAD(P)-dependent oxidoreductase n=1 Tax=Cryptosporangium minutisporangium TaxID=113569 RepID=UPI0035E73E31